MYWNATISERLLSKQKMQDLKWIKLISPGFAIFRLLHHPDHPFWQKNMTKQPGPLQNSNPCAKGPLYLYKVQIHVQKDPYTSTKFKSMCNMTPLPLQNSNPCAKWPFYKIQIQVYPQRVEPLQNSNPCQNKALQNQGSNQKNTPQNSGPKFIQKLLP